MELSHSGQRSMTTGTIIWSRVNLSAPPIRHEVIMGQSFWDVSVDTVELSTKIVRDRMYATGGMGWVRLIYSCNPVTE